ncbi:MAG: class I SAM-dependent methyltransferase [Gaiellaceae bacterium]
MSVFDGVAELYDRVRPAYPPALIDEVASLGPRILEIGPGTGQATRLLVERGAQVTAVELGSQLAQIAQRNVPAAHVVVADVETWEPEHAGFDAVAAFTSFHWLAPATRYATAARLLRPGGALAVVAVDHVRVVGGDPIWEEVQADYDAVVPSPDNRPPPFIDEVGDLREEFRASALFRDVEVRRHPWDALYTADEWIDVMRTYSPHIVRDPVVNEELYRRFRARIGARTVTKHYLATLTRGRRPS